MPVKTTLFAVLEFCKLYFIETRVKNAVMN